MLRARRSPALSLILSSTRLSLSLITHTGTEPRALSQSTKHTLRPRAEEWPRLVLKARFVGDATAALRDVQAEVRPVRLSIG